ncbi:Antibiotic efflux pump outer membrane protein ArpC [Methylobacterium cerastii]|uniref:Antibiotic efflux pump outer membrane protein ArpC n=1 Tax=Methylobacterium cerastii TaxID=932741 RepID=A0ABQ4QBC2_9HYPH|nr:MULTISPECIES: efflux transporter outer membrane subunit [Methylobacterium]TXM73174.1 efflux transporter outer membrane subunit [Methylobacterium sp. WL12]TXN80708.1 efflux transporter outer membrane subunit [Methylobacterium sp. WL8]GJD42513.1 Antibiotic efflux pump outer membrane protein ArpC [Methylobacterium cerastii]
MIETALYRRSARAAALAASLSLSACAVGPNYIAPEDPPVARYTKEPLANPSAADKVATRQGGSADQSFVSGADIPGQWWTLFRSKALNRLVEEALANNPNLEAAQASLRIAQQNVLAQKGTLYPSLSANPQALGARAPGLDLQSPLQNQNNYLYSLYTPQVTVAFNPDVFGLNRRTIEGLEATAENQRFQLEAAYLSLTANVVAAAIQEASLRAQIDATKRVIQAQTEVLTLYNKQLSLGQIAGADVIQQQAALSLSQQLLPPLEKQLAQQRNLLTALAGRLPSEEVAETFTLSALRLPTKVPVSLPSRLVQQRPDVKAAEALVQQASAGVGVAVANRLPQFSITAAGGSSAVRLAQITNPGAGFFTILGQATAPIFDAGTLYRRQRASEETLTQAQAQYRAVVIAAFQNVADALRALQSDAAAVAAASAAENATGQSLGLIRKQFSAGAVNSTQVLIAQQGYLSALVTSAGARATQYADTAALFQALGGGWWNRADVAPPPPETDPLKFL